ncbi:ubiquinone biosynthesis accessory factor UbiJ [Candidatus Colwellia aromaticivorans]|uniref:ubiquinone biosynthesis accessory factor UbiJ n=1 Tax=Candidatus Colwellia aromaticivorans TaxID=2267621 RepID=UPI000DF27BC0|nr:SCP2 sterol-binding domain-containing protein [Candidatus Colwellia aromaticivorans]
MTTTLSKIASSLMISQALTSALEVMINKTLALSTANVSLEKLIQKTLTLELEELGFPLSFTVCNAIENPQIVVTTLTEGVDCTIKTSLSTLRELKAEQQITELIKQNKLDLTGDVKVAQQFANVAENLDIDWQSELANQIGDIPTHKLMQLGKRVSTKVQFAAKQIKADASEYIVHEKRLVVTRSQIDQFNQQVFEVSEQVDMLNQRISQLINRKANH